jgi:hypothetical protein
MRCKRYDELDNPLSTSGSSSAGYLSMSRVDCFRSHAFADIASPAKMSLSMISVEADIA